MALVRRLVVFMFVLLSTGGFTVGTAAAGDGSVRCSPNYDYAEGRVCVRRFDGEARPTHQARTNYNYKIYNATVTGYRCDGNGQNCSGAVQMYYPDPFYTHHFESSYVKWCTWKTGGFWNDGESGARIQNAQSPLVA